MDERVRLVGTFTPYTYRVYTFRCDPERPTVSPFGAVGEPLGTSYWCKAVCGELLGCEANHYTFFLSLICAWGVGPLGSGLSVVELFCIVG